MQLPQKFFDFAVTSLAVVHMELDLLNLEECYLRHAGTVGRVH